MLPPMLRGKQGWQCGVWGALLILGCSLPKAFTPDAEAADPDVVRPPPGGPRLEKIPGPMLGPFDFYQDALIAACNKIVKKPHATAGRKDHPQFDVRWRVSTEYCAWMYYMPDGKYRVSKLTDQTDLDPSLRARKCKLPSWVEDSSYPLNGVQYIFALHNHLYDDRISDDDIGYIVLEAGKHSVSAETKDGKLWISIVAFLANDFEKPSCDGFYLYTPAYNQIEKWTNVQGRWICARTHIVSWPEDLESPFVEEAPGPCMSKSAP